MQPHETVWSLATAFVASRALHVVAELGVADHIGDEPVPATDLAARCDAQPDALNRLVRLLETQGLFTADAAGAVSHTASSRLLRSDHPMSMCPRDPLRPPGRRRHLRSRPRPAGDRAGDFFVDPLPSADAYLLMDVIHDWADAEAAGTLAAVRRAAAAGARVLVVENVLAEGASDFRGRTLDAIMLAVTGGRERTRTQLTALLQAAGFTAVRVLDTPGPLRIVEATAA